MAEGESPEPAPGSPSRKRGTQFELIGCGLQGHRLVGTDAAAVRPQDELVVREPGDGLRWHRCLRCDAWLPLLPPERPEREFPPERAEITLPLRGRPLRQLWVLRLIALDRMVHFVVLAVLAVAVFAFVAERNQLRGTFYRVLDALQHGVGGVGWRSGHGLLGDLEKAFAARSSTLWLIGLVLAAYAVLEAAEAVGLWRGRRWAEYLTFVATTVLLVPEIYELSRRITATRVLTLLINLTVVIYLLIAKRLFGLRGGGRADRAELERDSGWQALERVLPGPPGSGTAKRG